TIISASQTGNARRVCEELKTRFLSEKFAVNLVNAGEYKYKQLAREKIVIIVTSTQGDGEPPEEAVAFYKYLHSAKRPDLSGAVYAVFSLGDSSYEKFCQAGIDFDTQLAAAGATALLPRTDADVDYQPAAAAWADALTQVLKARGVSAGNPQQTTVPAATVTENRYSKEAPLTASLSVNQKITGRNSLKDVRHIEISAGDSGLHYQPGDSLGVWFENDPALADEIISLLHADAAAEITVSGHTCTLRGALIRHLELTQNNGGTVSKYAQLSQHDALSALISDKQAALHYAQKTPVAEMLRQAPSRPSAQAFADILRPLTPRLYSISSSQAEADDEIHLTVGVVRYDTDGRARTGGASGFLADHIQEGGDVRVFIESNDNFRLPADPDVPVIMIGAGTGIAPFRAFMQQRENDGASGKNWLFYGNQHFTEDFLYQTEWQRYVRDGVLTQISLAWSRDKPAKTYVQDKLREQGADVWRWIEDGAHIYVCGNAGLMASDTEDALLEIISRYGNRDHESADEFLSELRTARRYQRDVY
ncbi:NADPH-dependent assimilatory sulfite reductase flavoprotein subunit, partial [Morganella morganii]